MSINFPLKSAGEKLLESEVQGLRLDLLNAGLDYQTSGGSAGNYTLTIDAQVASLVSGQRITFKANHTSPGASDIDVNGIGAVDFKKKTPNGLVDLDYGDIVTDQIVTAIYDGTQFQIESVDTVFRGVIAQVKTGETIVKGDQLALVDGEFEKLRRKTLFDNGADLSFDTGNNQNIDACKLTVEKVLSAWYSVDDGRYELAVLTIDPDTLAITEGTNDTSLTDNGSNNIIRVAQLDEDKAIIVYQDSSSDIYAVVAEISGSTISLGTPQQVNTTGTIIAHDVCQLDTDKCAFVYAETGTQYARVATISGTTLTFGSEQTRTLTFSGAHIRCCKTDTDEFCWAAKNGSNFNIQKWTVSGTTVSNAGSTSAGGTSPDPNVAFGFCIYDTSSKRVAVAYKRVSTTENYIDTYTVSGTPAAIDSLRFTPNYSGVCSLERIAENRALLYVSGNDGSQRNWLLPVEFNVSTNEHNVQWCDENLISTGSSAASGCAVVPLLDGSADGKIRTLTFYNSGSQDCHAICSEEYNNYPEFKGIAAAAATGGDFLLAVRDGKLTGLSGLTANEELFADPDGLTTDVRPFKVGHSPSTTELEVNIERHPYSIIKEFTLAPSVDEMGDGPFRVTHDLYMQPLSIDLMLRDQAGNFSIGHGTADGSDYCVDEAHVLQTQLANAGASFTLEEVEDLSILLDATIPSGNALDFRFRFNY